MNNYFNAERLMDAAGVRFGHQVADIGTGRTGHLVFPLATRVGEEGKVYAVDIDNEAVQMIESLRRARGIHHLHSLWADAEAPGTVPIPESSLDVVFLVNALWAMSQPALLAQELGRLVKDDGRIFVMDWQPDSTHQLVPPPECLHHPRMVDVYFANADWHPVYEARLSPDHWARAYERL